MKLGILDADLLDPYIIREFGRYSDMFIRTLSVLDPGLDFEVYSVIEDRYPEHIDDCDAYVLTGSKYSAYDDAPWLIVLQRFIKQLYQAGKKQVGICFGHQMIAHSLGGRVEKSPQGWVLGVSQVKIFETMPWMRPQHETVQLRVSHQDQVMQLPKAARCLAGNDRCPIAAYQIAQSVLCFQGHPEFSPLYLEHLIHLREPSLDPALRQRARDSLKQDTDSDLVLRWLVQFIKQGDYS